MNLNIFAARLVYLVALLLTSIITTVSGDTVDDLVKIAKKIEKENYIINDKQISEIQFQIDKICEKGIHINEDQDYEKLQKKSTKIIVLDSIYHKYSSQSSEHSLLIALNEINFRYITKLQFYLDALLSEESVHNIDDMNAMQKLVKDNITRQEELIVRKTNYLTNLISVLDRAETLPQKKRGWLAINRIFNEIDVEISEGQFDYNNIDMRFKVAQAPMTNRIAKKPSEIIELLKQLQAKETIDEIKANSSQLINNIEQKLRGE